VQLSNTSQVTQQSPVTASQSQVQPSLSLSLSLGNGIVKAPKDQQPRSCNVATASVTQTIVA